MLPSRAPRTPRPRPALRLEALEDRRTPALDPTFGAGGKVLADFGSDFADAVGMAVQSDGKVVVAGWADTGPQGAQQFALLRYNPDGSPDTSFGTGGQAATGVAGTASDVTVLPDGKLLVAGYDDDARAAVLARYNPDGSPDTGFGDGGTGRVVTPLPEGFIYDLAVQADGKALVVGYVQNGTFTSQTAVLRYTTAGALDPTFGSGGKVFTPVGAFSSVGSGVAVGPDGRIVVSGYTDPDGSGAYDFAVLRYNPDGSPDPTFGSGGQVVTSFGPDQTSAGPVFVLADGKVLVGGRAGGLIAVARYNPDGSPDAGFGQGGKTLVYPGNFDTANVNGFDVRAMALQADGRILLAGVSYNGSTRQDEAAVARLTAAGTVDRTFEAGGRAVLTFGDGDAGWAGLAVRPDGRVVVAGGDYHRTGGMLSHSAITLARFVEADVPVLPPQPAYSLAAYAGAAPVAGGLVSALTRTGPPAAAGGPTGVAVVGLDYPADPRKRVGTWQYNLAGGTAAGDWVDFPANVSPDNAFLLAGDGDTRVRFLPKPGFTGYVSLRFKAWAQPGGPGEGTRADTTDPDSPAHSSVADRAWVAVGSVPFKTDADGTTLLPAVKEDAPWSAPVAVKNLLGIAGLEAPAGRGAAVIAASMGDGIWEYFSRKARAWEWITPRTADTPDGVDDTHALLLGPTDLVRFAPFPDRGGDGTLTFKTWDQSVGAAEAYADPTGPAFGVDPGRAVLDLIPVDDAPVLKLPTPAILDPVTTPVGPAGTPGNPTNAPLFSAFLAGATDVEGDALGVAVTAASGPGHWEVLKPGDVDFSRLPAGVSAGKALLLTADTRVRFVADPVLPGKPAPMATAKLTFRAWEVTPSQVGTQGPAGPNAPFSKDTKTATVAVNNHAPILTDANVTLPAVKAADRAGAGTAVSALLPTQAFQTFMDADLPAGGRGVAVVGLTGTGGVWEFSLNGGAAWTALDQSGPVSDTSAVLLSAAARVRFRVTDGSGVGTTATLTYKGWDQSAGLSGDAGVDTTGPLNSFSAATGTATLSVTT